MTFRCPSCSRPLYNRRRSDCEFCGATVPANLLLTSKQQTAIERMKQQDRKRHRESDRAVSGGASTGGSDIGGFDLSFGGGDGGGCD